MTSPQWSDEMRAAAHRRFDREYEAAVAEGHSPSAALAIAMDAVGLRVTIVPTERLCDEWRRRKP